MMNRNPYSRCGFTIMETIVVIALIGVLVAIAVPAVGSIIGDARRNHDIAMVEDAVAAARTAYAYDYDGNDDETYAYVFNASTGEAAQVKSTDGYGQWDQNADYYVAGLKVDGIAQDTFITCEIKKGEIVTVHWGQQYTWESLIGGLGVAGNNNMNKELREQVLAIDNEKRIKVDQFIIEQIQQYFIGKTADELQAILGPKYSGVIGDGKELMQYRIDNNSCSVNMLYPAVVNDYLATFGFPTTCLDGLPIQDRQYNYIKKYLFVSDGLIGETGKETKVHMRIKLKDGVCELCRVWVPSVDYLDVGPTW